MQLMEHPNASSELLHKLATTTKSKNYLGKLTEHPNVSTETLKHIMNNPEAYEEHREAAKEALSMHDPDVVHKNRVNVKLGTNKLRKIRDLILSKGKKELSPKELPPGDWSAGREPNGNISATKLQEAIDKSPNLDYNVSHTKWTGAQRHNDPPSKVFQLNLTTDQVNRLKGAGVWNAFKKIHDASRQSGHPVTPTTLGWARYTEDEPHKNTLGDLKKERELAANSLSWINDEKLPKEEKSALLNDIDAYINEEHTKANGDEKAKLSSNPLNLRAIAKIRALNPKRFKGFEPKEKGTKKGIFLDELQSDFGLSIAKQAAGQARQHAEQEAKAKGMSPEDTKAHVENYMKEVAQKAQSEYPEEDYQKISNILFGGRKPNEIIGEAFMQHLRNKKRIGAPVHIHSVESKAPISLGSSEKAAPGHFQHTYEQLPKKMGMEPKKYGDLPHQDNPEMQGQKTYGDEIRKFDTELEDFKKALTIDHIIEHDKSDIDDGYGPEEAVETHPDNIYRHARW